MFSQIEVQPIEYLESDGGPMAETGFHVTLIAYFLAMLRTFFRHRTDVYVGGNMFLYYWEDEPTKKVAPDLFVVFGVPNHERRVWKSWEEGKNPEVIFEFTSKSTWDEDLGSKKGLYAWLGVAEYFLFDPVDKYLSLRLQGFQLDEGDYTPLQPDKTGALLSEVLGLLLQIQDNELQLVQQTTNERLLPPLELAASLGEVRQHLQQEITARRAAEAEIERLRAEIQRLKGNQ